MGKLQVKHEFLSFWMRTVLPVATKCAKGFRVMKNLNENKPLSDEEEEEYQLIKNSTDANAIWYIGLLISDIEKAQIYGQSLDMLNSLTTVHGCLTDKEYWTNVWKNDVSSQEAKNLKEFAGLMDQLIKKV